MEVGVNRASGIGDLLVSGVNLGSVYALFFDLEVNLLAKNVSAVGVIKRDEHCIVGAGLGRCLVKLNACRGVVLYAIAAELCLCRGSCCTEAEGEVRKCGSGRPGVSYLNYTVVIGNGRACYGLPLVVIGILKSYGCNVVTNVSATHVIDGVDAVVLCDTECLRIAVIVKLIGCGGHFDLLLCNVNLDLYGSLVVVCICGSELSLEGMVLSV